FVGTVNAEPLEDSDDLPVGQPHRMKAHPEHPDGCRDALVLPNTFTIHVQRLSEQVSEVQDTPRYDLLVPQATLTRQCADTGSVTIGTQPRQSPSTVHPRGSRLELTAGRFGNVLLEISVRQPNSFATLGGQIRRCDELGDLQTVSEVLVCVLARSES